jgi:hypothetical protein
MPAGLGDVVLEGRISSEREEPPEQRGKQPRPEVRGERVAEDGAPGLRRHLDRIDLFAMPALRHDSLTRGAQIAHPVDLPERRLDVPMAVELDDRYRDRPGQSARATADGKQHVWAKWQAGAEDSPDQGVENGNERWDTGGPKRMGVRHDGCCLRAVLQRPTAPAIEADRNQSTKHGRSM